jgi:LacI family transcriptional regulator
MSRPAGTLQEIARRCAVSQSTVSRALNNAKHGRFSISPQLRERILSVARELNYRPSVAARNLAATSTKLVAVLGVKGIWADRVGPGEAAVEALAQVLDKAGYELCVQFYSQRHADYAPPALRVDGVVVTSVSAVSDLDAIEAAGLPYVSINGLAGPGGDRVIPDDVKGTRLALRHLLDLGHRNIAYLDNPDSGARHPSVFERRETFLAAAAEMNFRPVMVRVPTLPPETPWDSYYEPFLRDAILEQKATAVLAYSHHGAISLMRTAYDLGLIVPRDFSLACFNNEPATKMAIPSVTAVDLPAVRMGQIAAELLLKGLAAKASNKPGEPPFEPSTVKLEETLIVRESTAPPGGRTW